MKTGHQLPESQKEHIAALMAEGLTDELIGRRLGCTGNQVHLFRKKHNIAKQRPAAITGQPVRVPEPIRVYFDQVVNHLVKVYAAREASGDLLTEDEE